MALSISSHTHIAAEVARRTLPISVDTYCVHVLALTPLCAPVEPCLRYPLESLTLWFTNSPPEKCSTALTLRFPPPPSSGLLTQHHIARLTHPTPQFMSSVRVQTHHTRMPVGCRAPQHSQTRQLEIAVYRLQAVAHRPHPRSSPFQV